MRVEAVGVPGIPEVRAGDDLGALIARASGRAGIPLADQDVVVVASKVVAKAEGRSVTAADREDTIRAQTVRVVAARTRPDGRTTRVVQSRTGPVLAAAGVDASDVPVGTVLPLPVDPDASARAVRSALAAAAGVRPAVVVSDTTGRPWREGVSDFALGAAGLIVLDDARGRPDRFGRALEVTVRALGDEVAALADLARGKATGVPVALVRGLGAYVTTLDGPGAAGCVRVGAGDWFAHGHVEAVRAALGLVDGEVPPPPLDPMSEPLPQKVARAAAVASGGRGAAGAQARATGAEIVVTGNDVAVAVLVERLLLALWAEGLVAEPRRRGDGTRVDLTVPSVH